MECIKTVTEANYEVSDEAYHTLKRIVKKCEKLIKAYEKKLAQREKEREKGPHEPLTNAQIKRQNHVYTFLQRQSVVTHRYRCYKVYKQDKASILFSVHLR